MNGPPTVRSELAEGRSTRAEHRLKFAVSVPKERSDKGR